MKNAKEGFGKLFIAEILVAVGYLNILIPTKYWYFSLVFLVVDIVALFINSKGLNLISKDQEGYKAASNVVTFGLVLSIIKLLMSFLLDSSSKIVSIVADTIGLLTEVIVFVVCFLVLNTSSKYLQSKGNNDLAKFADTTKNLLLFAYCVATVVDFYLTSNVESSTVLLLIVITYAAAIVLIIGQIRYIIFLKKMKDYL
ncbi:MAG: hypothetical protein Q4E33_04370 [Erysipelotrichaceae bacterium]|nr:hypothetical protein [Erysipelotrichaceae bacterium]